VRYLFNQICERVVFFFFFFFFVLFFFFASLPLRKRAYPRVPSRFARSCSIHGSHADAAPFDNQCSGGGGEGGTNVIEIASNSALESVDLWIGNVPQSTSILTSITFATT